MITPELFWNIAQSSDCWQLTAGGLVALSYYLAFSNKCLDLALPLLLPAALLMLQGALNDLIQAGSYLGNERRPSMGGKVEEFFLVLTIRTTSFVLAVVPILISSRKRLRILRGKTAYSLAPLCVCLVDCAVLITIETHFIFFFFP